MISAGSPKTVLITGGTDGLGKAAAILLAERGYRVAAAGRSVTKRMELEAFAKSQNLTLRAIEMDVLSDDSVAAAVKNVLADYGPIDVLINNAGVGYLAVVEEIRMEDFKQQFETNLYGVLRVTQAVLPGMRERQNGRILMISSVAGLVTPPTYGAYSSSKHALEGLSNALRLELYPFGIRVVLIEPGYIMTNFQQTAKELARPYAEGMGASPYQKIYESAWKGASRGRSGSKTTAEDCARVMLEAIESPNPSVRYTVTSLATLVKWGKRLVSDKMLDQFLRRYYGVVKHN
jgi:NAD(P)-dependent dehydrogenase (short-subunit alcohol dehydrogenase family)